PAQPQGDVLPVSNSTLKSDDTTGAPVSSSGFLGAPTTLAPGVLESNEPTPAPQPAPVSAPVAAPATAPATATPVSAPAAAAPVSAPVSAPAAAASGRFVVQVGAVSDQTRAQQYQQRLSQQFSVPGRVIQNGAVWRIQLGPFASKAEASALQQRLQTEAQLQSFIASAQ
ncbi:septal ring lytic transglycosylase RlpA, partial [Salmonella enterica]|nr:septal ring lytic transglycosylase RlpA [Salmonella enterica]